MVRDRIAAVLPRLSAVRMVLYLVALLIAVAGCSPSDSAEDVVLADLGDGSWVQVLDSPLDDSLIGLIEGFSGDEIVADLGSLGDSWMRVWDSGTGLVAIMMNNPGSGPLGVRPDAEAVIAARGLDLQGEFGGIAGTMAMDLSDEAGPATAVVAVRGSFMGVFVFAESVPEDFAVSVVKRQLDNVPPYDPSDRVRPLLLAIFGPIFVISLWLAIRSTRHRPPQEAHKECQL